jgi:histidinol-phosphate/aromatic aminotransferase/cobyric acid decarboxylase-like protein
VEIDACFLSNPYATDEALRRLRSIPPQALERIVSHCPSQGAAIADILAPSIGVSSDRLVVANGACEVIQALLARASGPLILPLPTFSAYYEFATGPVIPLQLRPERNFALDFDELDTLVDRQAPATVVIINPNNPDGGLADHFELVDYVRRAQGRVQQVIVDESFGAFATEDESPSLAPLVSELPHLVVVNSLSKSHGIAGLRLGYAVMAPLRARALRARSLWNVNAFAEWFCGQLADAGYRSAYERARRRYVREARRLFDGLAGLPGVKAYPTAANFALLELDRPAGEVAAELLARHGIYVRDCTDKWGLNGDRYLRVAARREAENQRILAAFAEELGEPARRPLAAAAWTKNRAVPGEDRGPRGEPHAERASRTPAAARPRQAIALSRRAVGAARSGLRERLASPTPDASYKRTAARPGRACSTPANLDCRVGRAAEAPRSSNRCMPHRGTASAGMRSGED